MRLINRLRGELLPQPWSAIMSVSPREYNLVLPLMTPYVLCVLATLQRNMTAYEFEVATQQLIVVLKEKHKLK